MYRYLYSVLLCILLMNCVTMSFAYTSYLTERSMTSNNYDTPISYISVQTQMQTQQTGPQQQQQFQTQSVYQINANSKQTQEMIQSQLQLTTRQTQSYPKIESTNYPFQPQVTESTMKQQQFQTQEVYKINTNSKQSQEMTQSQLQSTTRQTQSYPEIETTNYPFQSQVQEPSTNQSNSLTFPVSHEETSVTSKVANTNVAPNAKNKNYESQSYAPVYERDCVFNLDSPLLIGIICPNGVYGPFPYPFGNFQFINCTNNQTYVEDCPASTSFNVANSYCEIQDINAQTPTSTVHRILTCPKEFKGAFLYPYDPTKYIVCQDGNMLKQSCPSDQFYSISSGICVLKEGVGDSDRVRSIQDMNPIGVFPYPFANTIYIKCINGELLIRQCAPGYLFSLSRKLCDISNTTWSFDMAVPITDIESQVDAIEANDTKFLECPSATYDTFIYPFLPTRYIKCSNGNTVIQNCSDGEVYSIREKRCLNRTIEYDNDIVGGIETSLKWTTNDHTLGVTCNPDSSGVYPHPEDWTKFVSCENGVIRVNSCPDNQKFDLEHDICV